MCAAELPTTASAACVQVWTFHLRCAIVVGVTYKNAPITDAAKSAALQKSLREMLGGEDAVVRQETVGVEMRAEGDEQGAGR